MSSDSKHENRCNVCKHPDREQIETALKAGNSAGFVEREYSLSRDSALRHAKYFQIETDAELAIRKAIGLGMDALAVKAPSATNTADLLRTLARMTGKLDNKREILAIMFPGKSDDQIAHFSTTGQWVSDESIQ